MGIGLAVAPRDGETAGDLAGRLLAALDAGQAAGGDSRGKQSGALLVGSIGLGPNILMIAERFMSILREAGFSLEVAAYGWDTIASFITGQQHTSRAIGQQDSHRVVVGLAQVLAYRQGDDIGDHNCARSCASAYFGEYKNV